MPTDLPAYLQKTYDALATGQEVHVLNLYRSVLGKETNNPREAQQTLGPYITRLNRRIRGEKKKVTPGALKGTYVLADAAE